MSSGYALMRDAKVMVRTPTGAAWHSILPLREGRVVPPSVMTWPTREGARDAADMQGATVIPINQVRA